MKTELTPKQFTQLYQDWTALAIKRERERIIKLLEADCKDGIGDHLQGCSHEVAIALIKGESEPVGNSDKLGENK